MDINTLIHNVHKLLRIWMIAWLIVAIAGIVLMVFEGSMSFYLTMYAVIWGFFPGGIVWVILTLIEKWKGKRNIL